MDKDVVLNGQTHPVFQGSQDEVLAWLKMNTWANSFEVMVAATMEFLPVPVYIARGYQGN